MLGLALLALPSCVGVRAPAPPADEIFPSRYLEAILKPPAGYDSSRTYPLLVALHGYGDNARNFAPVLDRIAASAFFVAVPQGEHPRRGGGWSWFDPTAEPGAWAQQDAHTVASVVELIEALKARHHIGPVFVLGFSQGASLAYLVGLRHPEIISGIVAVAGVLPPIDTAGALLGGVDLSAARGVRVLVARGVADQAVPRRAYVAQVAFLRAHGFRVTAYEFGGGHDVPDEAVDRVRRWLRAAGR